MQIAFHLGAACTDNDALIWSLLRDRDPLLERGIVVPRPRRFRTQLGQVTARLRGDALSSDLQNQMLEFIAGDLAAERVILSDPGFLASPSRVFDGGSFYGNAGARASWLRRAFPDHECSFYIGIRNPVTFVSALVQAEAPLTYDTLLSGADPEAISWSEVLSDIRDANPDTPLTVWCDEDTPLLWPTILRTVTGTDVTVPMSASLDIAEKIMSPEGTKALRDSLSANPPKSAQDYHAVIGDHLERYALDTEVEQTIDLPGWTSTFVDELTIAYEDDLAEIAGRDNVTLLLP